MRIAWASLVGFVLVSCHGSRSPVAPRVEAAAPATAVAAAPDRSFDGRLEARMAGRDHAAGTDDVDGDGVVDCWDARYHGGSGFGGITFAVQRGCTGAPLVVDTSGWFGEFLGTPALPAGLDHPGAVAGVIDWLYGAAHRVCDDATCPEADGSFHWLRDELAARGRAPRPIGPFARVWRSAPRAQAGVPALPPSQVVATGAALVAYAAHNHGELTRAGACGGHALWTTRHGVALEDAAAGSWRWVYVSTGIAKLRHRSLERVECAGGLVAIERTVDGTMRELVVVAPATGGVGHLDLHRPWTLTDRALTLDGEALPVGQVAAMLAPPD